MFRKQLSISILLLCLVFPAQAQVFYRAVRMEINTNLNAEMAPAIHKDGIVFSSNRKNEILLTTVDQEGNFTYDLYYVEKKGHRSWSSPRLFSRSLASRFNESSVCFSPDGNTIYYTATLRPENIAGDFASDTLPNGIYIATWNGQDWSDPQPFPFNSLEFDIGYPTLSGDGKRLYFSARNPAGYGKFDLYYSDLENGLWTDPVNLGNVVNTAESEVFPFLYEDTRLYFSSAGHGGSGGLDIFYSDLVDGEWTTPVNMPRPFNSRSDDFGFVANAEIDTGYFTSNRRGSDDIYSFISAFPAFAGCPEQVDETFCYEFFESGTMDLDTTTLRYEWDLGDGTRIRSERAEHCYEEPGYYLVRLNVIDTLTGDVYFSEASYDLNIQPIEQPYISAPDRVEVDKNVEFDASASVIRSFDPENYYWDFGDGEVGDEITTRHRYVEPGTYTIRLGITGPSRDNPGEKGKACASRQIIVVR